MFVIPSFVLIKAVIIVFAEFITVAIEVSIVTIVSAIIVFAFDSIW